MSFVGWLLVITAWCWCIIVSGQKIQEVSDWSLCNNGRDELNPFRGYDCVNEKDSSKIEKCDPRVVPSKECREIIVETTNKDPISKVNEAFDKLDNDITLRRLRLSYPKSQFNEVAHAIDLQLTPRPYLFVRNESFPWQKADTLTIVVDKFHHNFEKRLRLFSAVHYPDPQTCSQTALMISRTNCVHPGYASAISMYYSETHDHPYAVMAIYVSESNTLFDGGAFIGAGDNCPHLNRWLCTFLASTSCSFPSNITDCRDTFQYERCVRKIPETERFSLIYYKGSYLKRDQPLYHEMVSQMKHPQSDTQRKLAKDWDSSAKDERFRHVHPKIVAESLVNVTEAVAAGGNHSYHHHAKYRSHRYFQRNPQADQRFRVYRPMDRDPIEALFQSLYFLRPNARFRLLVAKELRHFALDNDIDGLYGYRRQERKQLIEELKQLDGESLYDAKEASAYGIHNETTIRHLDEVVDTPSPGRRRLHRSSQGKGHRNLQDLNGQPYRCIAVHMRRGDRIMKDLNDTAMWNYCRENMKNPAALDKGCGSIPFQMIHLTNITKAASTLVDVNEVNNLIVITDDDEWILSEMEQLKHEDSPWRVNVLLSPWNQDRNFTLAKQRWSSYGRLGLQAGVHFLSSMEVIRNCEGFVGHFGSAATHIFYVNMCHQHGVDRQRIAVCPPFFDLRNTILLNRGG